MWSRCASRTASRRLCRDEGFSARFAPAQSESNALPNSASLHAATLIRPLWQSTASRRSRGFTLIELILVMVILIIASAMVVPSIRGFGRGRRVEDAGTELLAQIHYARVRAIMDGVTYRLNLDAAERSYQLTRQENDMFVPLGEEAGRIFVLPDGVKMSWELPQHDDGVYLSFVPTGRSEIGTIRLEDETGRTVTIASESATDLFRIVPQQPQQ